MFTLMDYQPLENFLNQKLVLITGAGSGIGRAVAKVCAKFGATVALLGRSESNLHSVYDEIEAQGSRFEPIICQLDLMTAEEESYNELSHLIGHQYEQLHGLIHCAGVLGKMTTLEQYPLPLWQETMQVNVTAAFLLTRALLPCLRQAEESSVVFTSSGVGRKARAHWGAYSISKFAIEGMMQIFADEEKKISNVRINALNPGATRTVMRAKAYPAEDPNHLKTADEVAMAYLCLLGQDGRFFQGAALSFDDKLPVE